MLGSGGQDQKSAPNHFHRCYGFSGFISTSLWWHPSGHLCRLRSSWPQSSRVLLLRQLWRKQLFFLLFSNPCLFMVPFYGVVPQMPCQNWDESELQHRGGKVQKLPTPGFLVILRGSFVLVFFLSKNGILGNFTSAQGNGSVSDTPAYSRSPTLFNFAQSLTLMSSEY